jgi:hypothetical protein
VSTATVTEMPLVSADPMIQHTYEMLVSDGQTHRMADLLAHRKFPGMRTDAVFMEGKIGKDQFGDTPIGREMGEFYRSAALAAGVNPHGKVYLHGLATYPGDPTAWVDSRGDVLRVAREKGLKVSGMVEYTPPDPGVPRLDERKYHVADDIVQEAFEQRAAANPDLANASPEKQAEAKHELREWHSGRGSNPKI